MDSDLDFSENYSDGSLTTFSTIIRNFTHTQPSTSTGNDSNHLLSSICNFISDDSWVTHTISQGRLKDVVQNNGTFNGRGNRVSGGTFAFTGNANSNQLTTNFTNSLIHINTSRNNHNIINCESAFDSSHSGISFLNVGGNSNNVNPIATIDAPSNITSISSSNISSGATIAEVTPNASGSSISLTSNNVTSGTDPVINAASASNITVSNNNVSSNAPSLVNSIVGSVVNVATGTNNTVSNSSTTTTSGGATINNLQSR